MSEPRFPHCPRCRLPGKGLTFTSASYPCNMGDGRPKAKCTRCGYEWTNNRKPGEGKKDR